MTDKRAEARLMCADMIEVSWQDASARTRSATAVLEDISKTGACLQLESPLPVGSQVGWSSEERSFSGVVRYCTFREIGYFAGVEFEPDSKWTPESYLPAHLLDVTTLVEEPKGPSPAKPPQ
jgi:hypothetical protein